MINYIHEHIIKINLGLIKTHLSNKMSEQM